MTTEQDAKSKVHLRLLGRSIGLPSEAREVIEIVWKAAAEFFQAQQPMPAWMQYDPATDVLTIHGRKYSAALFGRDGFLGDPGDLLRIEKGGDETVTLTRIPVEHPAQPVATDVGNLEYMGNSVSFIYQKMRAYKDGMGKVWQALRDNGIHPDGQTHAADAIRKALAQPAQPVQPAACQYCNGTGDVHGIDGEWRGECTECKTAPAVAQELVACVLAEVAKATAKFPTWPTDPLHALAVLGEEFGELTQAVLQSTYEPHKSTPDDVKTEAIQTAAMALRFLMSLNRYQFQCGEQHHQGTISAAEAEKAKGGV